MDGDGLLRRALGLGSHASDATQPVARARSHRNLPARRGAAAFDLYPTCDVRREQRIAEPGGRPDLLVGTERQFVWLWLRNDSTREITLSGAEYSVALVGERNTQHVRSRLDRHTLIGSRRLRPGEQSPLTSFYWDPGRFEAVELREDPQGSRWKPIDVSQLTGRYKARWLLSIPQPSTDTSIQLSSAAIDWIPPGQ